MKVIKQLAKHLWGAGKLTRKEMRHLLEQGFIEEEDVPSFVPPPYFRAYSIRESGVYNWTGEFLTLQSVLDRLKYHPKDSLPPKMHILHVPDWDSEADPKILTTVLKFHKDGRPELYPFSQDDLADHRKILNHPEHGNIYAKDHGTWTPGVL